MAPAARWTNTVGRLRLTAICPLAVLALIGCAVGLRPGGDIFLSAPNQNPESRGKLNGTPVVASSARSLSELDANTQRSILDAMRAGRATDDGHGVAFTNPEQQLHATVEIAETTVSGLRGARVTFADASLGRRPPNGTAAARRTDLSPAPGAAVEGVGTTRATIARAVGNLAVTEWWTNTSAGIEQGFTIATRPAGNGPLALEQTITTRLTARVSEDGSAVTWSQAGHERLRFEHVRAWDSTGRALPARLETRGDRIAMVVDDTAARYPVTIDPTWTQQAYLKASNTGGDDNFGWAVAVSGDTVVVGAGSDDSSATGVNGNQADDSALNAGAAYVFVRTGTTWTQQAYLKASNTDANDRFGYAVAVSGDTVVVGAYGEASSATGVGGNQADNSAVRAGAVYVFVHTGTTWTQQAYLKASNADAFDNFGVALAVSGDTVVVGAEGEDSGATGVNGNQVDNSATQAGAAYVFVRTGTTWTQQAYLKASNTGATDVFGSEVAVSGDTVVVGAKWEASSTTGVNGNEADNSANQAGAAYVFLRTGTTWTQQAYLKASNTGASDNFGDGVAVSGDTLVIGAPWEASSATGIDGNQADDSAGFAGAAYVFVRTGTTWTQQAYLKASNTGAVDQFGRALALSGDTVVVGAPTEDSSATGANGNQADNSAADAGGAYVFVRTGTTWAQQAYLKASNTGAGDSFGWAVAISGDTVVVGAYEEDSSATGVNDNQADNSAPSAGAAYLFRLNAIHNGTFDLGTNGWLQFATPDLSYIVAGVTNGVLEFYRVPPPPGTTNQAVVFQETGLTLASGAPIAATFDLGNSSTARKRIAILLHDSTFQDLSVCTFWLPAGAPLRTYEMRTHTTQAWGNATISFYAASAGSDGGAYRVDNVALTREPTQSATRTDCVDPLAPVPPGGPNGANLLTNGDFSTGLLSPWLTFGTIAWQIASNVFEFIRPDATPPAGVVFQPSGSAAAAGEILTATFELGNSSAVRKRVTVLVHDVDFSDLTACTWYLEPGAPLAEYQMRTYVSESGGWDNATLSVYAATVGTESWIRLDNATLQSTPAAAAIGTECLEPGDPGAPLRIAGASASRVMRRTAGGASTFVGTEPRSTSPDDGRAWQAVADVDGAHTLDWPLDLRGATAATLSFESRLSAGLSRGEIQVSLDGVTWQTVGVVPASDDWTLLAVDLSAFAGQVVRVRFAFDAVAPALGHVQDRWFVRGVTVTQGAPRP